jgi:hypothetical protein
MSGRSVLYLLAVFILVVQPAICAGQDNPTRVPPSRLRVAPRIPAFRAPIREPQHSVSRFPVQRTDSSGFSQVVRAAGTIFSGTVTSIARHPGSNGNSVASVTITFHIDNALRGAISGSNFALTEWIGLWSGGQRYRLGEHVVLFVYAPSKLGLSSSVAGPMGRFAMDAKGTILLSPEHVAALRTHPVLGGRSRVRLSDFALAVRQASEEERTRGDHEN